MLLNRTLRSIRVHGGSNHLLAPTGLLQRWAGEGFARSDLFGVRAANCRTRLAAACELWPPGR